MLTRWVNAFKRQALKATLRHPNWDKFKKKDRKRRWSLEEFFDTGGIVMNFLRGSWVRPFEEEPFKPISTYAWPLYSNPRFNRELTKFMFSFRDEASLNKNINNLMFITGPEKCGKTWLLKQNIDKFKSVKSGAFCIEVDLDEHNSLNFETFLDAFEGKICEFLVGKADVMFKDVKLVRWEMVIDLLKYSHDKLYLDIHLGKLLEKNIKNDDLLILSSRQKTEIGKIFASFVNRKTNSTPIVDNIEKILEVLSEGYKELGHHKAMVKAALNLSLSYHLQEEINSCPIKNFSGCYRTGLKTSWFLLDLLDLIGGYHEMNLKNLEYPHILLVVCNPYSASIQKLLEIETNEDRPTSWIESIALKLHNDFGWRNHVPLIFEGGSYYFNTQIYEDLNLQETAFPTIEYRGVESAVSLFKYLSHIYNEDHIALVYKNIGLNLHDLRIFTDDLIHTENKKIDFYEKLDAAGPSWDAEYHKFLYKINCLYDRPEVEYLAELGTLDYAILDVLYNFSKSPEITVPGPIGEELKQKPIIRAFLELNLLYAEKHQSFMSCRRAQGKFFKRFYKAELKKMPANKKLDFHYWKLTKGIHASGMDENLARDVQSAYFDGKEEADWDVDLYDEFTGRREDPGDLTTEFRDSHSKKLNFQSYGKFTEFPYFRFNILPFTILVDKFMNYPAGYTHLKHKHEKEGNPEPVITQPYDKWLDRKHSQYSILPQTDSEVKLSTTPEENKRAYLKMAYIYDNPEKMKNPIKWRHVRRYAHDVYFSKASK